MSAWTPGAAAGVRAGDGQHAAATLAGTRLDGSRPAPPGPARSRAHRGRARAATPARAPARAAASEPPRRSSAVPRRGIDRADEALAAGAQHARESPAPTSRSRWASSARLCVSRLAEADARIEPDRARGRRRLRSAASARAIEEGSDLGDDVVVARLACMVRGSPCMCISITPQPSSAAVARLSGAKRKAVTSFHIVAPRRRRRRGRRRASWCRWRAGCRSRAAMRLDQRQHAGELFGLEPARRAGPGRTRRRCRGTSAPSAISAPGVRQRPRRGRDNVPPSEKLSGVSNDATDAREDLSSGRRSRAHAGSGSGAAHCQVGIGTAIAARNRGPAGRLSLRLVALGRDALEHVDDLLAA